MKPNFTDQQVPPVADSLDDRGANKLKALGTAPGIPYQDSFKLMMDHKRSVARASLFIGMPLFLAMAIKNFVRGDNIMAFSDCAMLAILVLLGFAVMRRIEPKTEYKIYAIAFRLFFAVMGVSLFYDIGFQSNFSRIEWCYIYPVLVFLAVGVKEGAIWVSMFYAAMAFLVVHFDLQGISLRQMQDLRSRFLVSFFAVCTLSLFLEYGFRRAERRLLHHQLSLKESENRYRQAYERLDVEMQERKRAEEELLNAAQQWRTTFDSITDTVILLDLQGKILRCNMAFKTFAGRPFNEIINRPCWEVTPGTKTPIESPFLRMKETLHRAMATLPLNGRWFNVTVDPILDEAGSLIGAVNIMSDITERKQTEEALSESEDRYRDLVEYSQYLICTHDLKGQILSLNQGAARKLGYDPSFLLNKNIQDFLAPEVRGGFDAYLDTIRKDGVAKGMLLVQTATGEKRVWEFHNTLRTEGVAEPIVRGMAHDITERKRIEDERKRLIKDLQKALAEIKQLSGLLPICSGCKKIRDDKGYWNQIEAYISDHSEATFSHGLCPDCLKKLYPNL